MILAILIYLLIGAIICELVDEPSPMLVFLWLPAFIAAVITFVFQQK